MESVAAVSLREVTVKYKSETLIGIKPGLFIKI